MIQYRGLFSECLCPSFHCFQARHTLVIHIFKFRNDIGIEISFEPQKNGSRFLSEAICFLNVSYWAFFFGEYMAYPTDVHITQYSLLVASNRGIARLRKPRTFSKHAGDRTFRTPVFAAKRFPVAQSPCRTSRFRLAMGQRPPILGCVMFALRSI
jgi:hypothetical protein